MSTTTTNFGWTVPSDTDLVKDGAAAIRTALGGVDTSFVDLKGGTTGQVLSKASGTDLDYTWVTPEIGDITAVVAGTGISGGGTTGSVTVTNTMATAIDAKGDLIAGTGADAFSRLAVGTNGYLLTADSAEATGMKWAAAPASGGMTLLSTTTLSGTNTDISVTSGYKYIYAEIFGLTANSTDGYLQIYPNATSGIGYGIVMKRSSGSNGLDNTTQIGVPDLLNRTGGQNAWVLTIDNCDSATAFKPFQLWGNYNNGAVIMNNSGAVISTSAITSLRFTNAAGGTWAGGTVKLYGVN